jgi:hypothetical protein
MSRKKTPKPTGNIQKVVALGLQDRVFQAIKDKQSVESLAKELIKEGINITPQSIRKFIKTSKEAQKEVIRNDLSEASEYKKMVMDYNHELKSLLDEVKSVKSEVKTDKDWVSYNQMFGRLLQTIELFSKLSGDLQQSNTTKVDIKVMYNQINTEAEKLNRTKTSEIFEDIIDVDSIVIDEDKEQESIINGETNE